MTINPWVYWILALVLIVVSGVRGIRFRRGTDRALLRVYRNPRMAATWRNGVLFMGPAAVAWSPLLVVSLPFVLRGAIDPALPRNVSVAVLAGPIGYFCVVTGILNLLAGRPPERLIPAWLEEDDRRVGWVRPRPTWFDVLVFFFVGVGAVLLGLIMAVGAILFLVDPGIFGW